MAKLNEISITVNSSSNENQKGKELLNTSSKEF